MLFNSSILFLFRAVFGFALLCLSFSAKPQQHSVSATIASLGEIKAMPASKEKVTQLMRYARSPQVIYTNELKHLMEDALNYISEENKPESVAPVITVLSIIEINLGNVKEAQLQAKKAEVYLPKLSGRYAVGLASDLTRIYTRSGDLDKAMFYNGKLESLTKDQPEFIIPRVLNLRNRINLELRKGENKNLQPIYKLALKLAKDSKNEELIRDTRFAYAQVLLSTQNEKEAFEIIKELIPDLDNTLIDRKAAFFEILAKNYKDVGDYKNAFVFYKKIYNLPESPSQQRSIALANMILSSFELKDYDNYDEYFRALKKYQDNYSTIIALKTRKLAEGKYYEAVRKPNMALKTYLTGYQIKHFTGKAPREDIAFQLAIAGIYADDNESKLAKTHVNIAEVLIKKNTVPIPLKLSYFATVKKLNKIAPLSQDSLVANLENEIRLKDTVYQKSLAKIANELETKYRVTEKEQQLLLAKKQEELNKAEISKHKQRNLFISIAAIIGIALLTTLIYIQLQRKKQQNLLYEANLNELRGKHRIEIMDRLTEVQEQEKKRVAEQLHDEVGAMLSIAKLNINTLKENIFLADSDAEKKLVTTKQIMNDISETVRNISHTLMPIALEKYGFKSAVIDMLTAIKTANQLTVEHVIEGLDNTETWPKNFSLSAYRIIQEILNNAIKHAQATNLFVQLIELENSLTIYIEDNGKGIIQDTDAKGAGMKLLESNIAYLSGKLEIKGQPNEGTFALIELPIPTMQANEN